MSNASTYSPNSFLFRLGAGTGEPPAIVSLGELAASSLGVAHDSRRSRVLVVDQHAFVRESIVRLLNRQPDLTCCGEAGTLAEASRLLEHRKPNVLLVDLHLSDGNALDLIEFLRPQFPQLVILVLSHCNAVAEAEKALRAGANGYLLKHDASEEMLDAIRALLIGKLYVSQEVAGRMLAKLLHLPAFPANKSC